MAVSSNKRIAKNTLLLYTRMLLIMVVSLFTVRIVLNTLGVEDYGIYNVVGGLVTMFTFLNGTLSNASQRYFAFEIGSNNYNRLQRIFSQLFIMYILLAIIILFLAESIGLWFLNNKMNIPDERLDAAFWVYQFSVAAFVVNLIKVPYNALIIAHERMNFYAYISVVEVLLKLFIVYILVLVNFDKLILYSILMFGVYVVISSSYYFFCINKYKECQLQLHWDKPLFYEIWGYTGWNVFGAISNILKGQGINILLNIFFNPVINASRGIAFQINNILNNFAINFLTAVNPHIIKQYAKGDKLNVFTTIFQSSKFAFLLLLILSTPVLFEMNFLLTLWLKILPDYVVIFSRLIVINVLIDVLALPMATLAQATGKIRKYQLIISATILLNMPFSYIVLKLGFEPYYTAIISIIISIISLLIRLILLNKMVGFPILIYLKKVILPITIISSVSSCLLSFVIFFVDQSFLRFMIVCSITVMTILSLSFSIALNNSEKVKLITLIKNKYHSFGIHK